MGFAKCKTQLMEKQVSLIKKGFYFLFMFCFSGSSSATGQVSHGKQSEADDMAYFEKRYQERASYYIYCLI